MQLKLPFDTSQPISGEASIAIDKSAKEVFNFIADNFFENYQKWATDVVELEPLDTAEVAVGNKAKQVRDDNGNLVESIFQFTGYNPNFEFRFEGITAPYKHCYILDEITQPPQTQLTFRFELLELDVFMRPFQKLIRIAIEEGAETTVSSIKELLSN